LPVHSPKWDQWRRQSAYTTRSGTNESDHLFLDWEQQQQQQQQIACRGDSFFVLRLSFPGSLPDPQQNRLSPF
jgi:hypothetical protein